MIIAIDFDGTIVEDRYPEIGAEKPFAIQTLKMLIEERHKLILWTVREDDTLEDAVRWCKERGVEFYAVNKDYPEEKLEHNDSYSRKIKADIFIDDRNIGGLPDWGTMYHMLKENRSMRDVIRDTLNVGIDATEAPKKEALVESLNHFIPSMKNNIYIVFAFMLALLSSCGGKLTVDNSVVSDFDTDRFLGEWYEIARFDHWFERDMQNTKAKYTLLENGRIEVVNSGIKDGKQEESKGKAKFTDTPALLRVSFFGPFYSDYRILLVDKGYSYALVGSGSDDYLWILSRTPVLSDEAKTVILNEAKRRGYKVGNLIWVRHN